MLRGLTAQRVLRLRSRRVCQPGEKHRHLAAADGPHAAAIKATLHSEPHGVSQAQGLGHTAGCCQGVVLPSQV